MAGHTAGHLAQLSWVGRAVRDRVLKARRFVFRLGSTNVSDAAPHTPARVLIAADKFKGSLTAVEVAEHVEAGLRSVVPGLTVEALPVADGGDGTVDAAVAAGFERRTVPGPGPAGGAGRGGVRAGGGPGGGGVGRASGPGPPPAGGFRPVN